jgi:hypothetical protein
MPIPVLGNGTKIIPSAIKGILMKSVWSLLVNAFERKDREREDWDIIDEYQWWDGRTRELFVFNHEIYIGYLDTDNIRAVYPPYPDSIENLPLFSPKRIANATVHVKNGSGKICTETLRRLAGPLQDFYNKAPGYTVRILDVLKELDIDPRVFVSLEILVDNGKTATKYTDIYSKLKKTRIKAEPTLSKKRRKISASSEI